MTVMICLLALLGAGIGLYPMTASWLSAYQQSLVIKQSMVDIDKLEPSAEDQLMMARAYNAALNAGVALESGGNVPVGFAEGVGEFTYNDILSTNNEGLMSRLRIDGIDVDLPVYHGTDEKTLLKGAGHLEGSHLPVGGEGTRSVVTAHRGLASATMFDNLGELKPGDRMTINTLGLVLTYEVTDSQVIEPTDTAVLMPEVGKDQLTLITCTPLGVNTHRIVVNAKRVTPTPIEDVNAANADPAVGFPWWAVFAGGTVVLVGVYLVRSGFTDARRRDMRRGRHAV